MALLVAASAAGAFAAPFTHVIQRTFLEGGCSGTPFSESRYTVGKCDATNRAAPTKVYCNSTTGTGLAGDVRVVGDVFGFGDSTCTGQYRQGDMYAGANGGCVPPGLNPAYVQFACS